MGVDDRLHIGARRIDRAVDHPLRIQRRLAPFLGLAIEREAQDIFDADLLRTDRSGQQEAIGGERITDADMPVAVDYPLVRKDVVCQDEVLFECVEGHDKEAVSLGVSMKGGALNCNVACSPGRSAASRN